MSGIVQAVGKKYVNKYASQAVKQVIGDEDPYYDVVETVKADGTTKVKRTWKKSPQQGLSQNDSKVLKKFRKRAWSLDMGFQFCGFRLGWSAVFGILPVVGDCINIYFAIQLVRLAQQVDGGLPVAELSKMMSNIVFDFVLGLVPFLGIIAGALYRANSRNALILEHFLTHRARQNLGLELPDKTPPLKVEDVAKWFDFVKKKDDKTVSTREVTGDDSVTTGYSRSLAASSTATTLAEPSVSVPEERSVRLDHTLNGNVPPVQTTTNG